jgi:leucyl aminopeptidase (aminopeptidase T)
LGNTNEKDITMADIRHQKLAKVLVHYSLRLKPGDKFIISGPAFAAPLIREVYREAVRAGAHIETNITIDGLEEILLREGNDEQLSHVSDMYKLNTDYFDARLVIRAQQNTRALSGIDPARMALQRSAYAPLFKRALDRMANGEVRWCGTLFPTHAHAQDAGMSLSDYEDFVYGVVRFSYPAIYDGNEVADVQLTFRDGKVVESSATRGLDFLNATLDTDAGARYLGEVAFGLNYTIKRFSKDTLFDEKIGGTMHMALGASLPESGGVNESGLHWDMVCDLRAGKVYADRQLCYENGKFII